MDIGDLIRLIIFGFIFLSFFSGIFDRRKDGEKPKPGPRQQRPARPRELAESGGPPPVRPVARPAPPIEVGPSAPAPRAEPRREERQPPRRDTRPAPVPTYDDAIERGEVGASELRPRPLAEQDISDMPSPMDTRPERRDRRGPIGSVGPRRRRRSDAQVLRRWLRDPDTLGRAFIVKEVIDPPLSLRERQ